jgi:hypothetical protein
MAKKPAKYSKEKTVKDLARKRVGVPPPSRALDEREQRPKIKHKKKWPNELEG